MLRLSTAGIEVLLRPEQDIHVAALPPDVRKWLCPSVRTVRLMWGLRPGRSPISREQFAAGQSRRLTSDGRAATNIPPCD